MSDIEGLRFLVVEDQGFQRWLVGNLLEGLGARAVYAASDGRAALEVLSTIAIDVVVSDLDMPGMDGMELIRHMAENRHRASLIVVSALDPALVASVETMARAYGVDLLASIQKPLNARKLEAAIATRAPRGPTADAPADAREFTVEEISEGLRKKEFEAFFQPKVGIRTCAIEGAEALARWRHPTRGLVQPEEFIDLVESFGLIDALTQSMVEQAMLNCRAWQDAGIELKVSVNLSALSLQDTSLGDRMTRLAQIMNVAPRLVTFEITESAATRDLGRKLENLSRLRMKGFGLSIDDYGTGYSSMQRLSKIPFTELKIDQSFVRNVSTDPACRAMVESSLELAQKLAIASTAEGVEGQGEWEMLLALGCSFAQGYFIARPMGPTQFLDWVRKRLAGADTVTT